MTEVPYPSPTSRPVTVPMPPGSAEGTTRYRSWSFTTVAPSEDSAVSSSGTSRARGIGWDEVSVTWPATRLSTR